MAGAAPRAMTPEEFFVWRLDQDELFELFDGHPVPRHRMMTGASMRHDRATVNIIVSLGSQMRGKPCRPTTADVAIRTSIKGLRRPDVMVECAPLTRDAYEAREPRLVVEVLSCSTTSIDQTRKVEEYKRHPILAYILLVETLQPPALLYRRVGDAWEIESFEGIEAIIALPSIGAELALADVYDELTFSPRRDFAEDAPVG